MFMLCSPSFTSALLPGAQLYIIIRSKRPCVRPDYSGRPLHQEKAVIGQRDTVKTPLSFSMSISPLDELLFSMPEALLRNEMSEVPPFWFLTQSSTTGLRSL